MWMVRACRALKGINKLDFIVYKQNMSFWWAGIDIIRFMFWKNSLSSFVGVGWGKE